MTRSSFDALLGIVWPPIVALTACFVFEAGAGGASLVVASFGAAVTGVSSSASTSGGSAMQRQRWHGACAHATLDRS